jgi:hypothetical protein
MSFRGSGTPFRSSPLAALILAGILAGALPVQAQNVRGLVLSAADSSTVPAAMVILHRITADTGQVADSTQSDAEGRFSLTITADDTPETIYAAAAVRDGVSYFGPAMHAGMEPPDPYRIFVAETETITEPVEGNAVTFRHVVISPTAHGLLQIAEVVDVAGVPGRAMRMEDGSRPIWSIQLPDGAQSWSAIEGGLPPQALTFADDRVEARATLPPNGIRLAYSYYSEGSKLEFPVEHATDRFEIILVGAEVKALSGLRPGDATDLPPGGAAKRFVAAGIPPGGSVGLTIRSDQAPRGPVLIWGLIGVALLAAAGLSAVAARRSTG